MYHKTSERGVKMDTITATKIAFNHDGVDHTSAPEYRISSMCIPVKQLAAKVGLPFSKRGYNFLKNALDTGRIIRVVYDNQTVGRGMVRSLAVDAGKITGEIDIVELQGW